jgi:hypothetical protein
MSKKKKEVEERFTQLEKQIEVREAEIKRLHTLYEGG